MIYKLIRPDTKLDISVTLPASKSISNRLLLIRALSGTDVEITNLSDSDDTVLMMKALASGDNVKDIGHAGTAMRFLTAFYAGREGRVVLTGSERMKQRPIGPLVDALRALGAEMNYMETDACPPLEIKGSMLKGGEIEIPGNISSQFISALLMIAPYFEEGLVLNILGDVVSSSYIKMTLELMKEQGAHYKWDGNRIAIQATGYAATACTVESDWSAASYWYAMMLSPRVERIRLKYLNEESLQGDSNLVEIFNKLGVKSTFEGGLCILEKAKPQHDILFEYDFINSPDIVQSMAVILCLAGIPFRFGGTKTLRIKETDRITALQHEMKKLGFLLKSDLSGSFLAWNGDRCEPEKEAVISTYHDHRMAMAFAPAALFLDNVRIDDPMVVTKSYPTFWEDMKRVGFFVNPEEGQ